MRLCHNIIVSVLVSLWTSFVVQLIHVTLAKTSVSLSSTFLPSNASSLSLSNNTPIDNFTSTTTAKPIATTVSWEGQNRTIVTILVTSTDHVSTISVSTGPVTAGPVTTGPVTTGPVMTGPVTTGPASTGPVSTGPVTAGPVATGPVMTGPVSTGSVSTNPVSSGTPSPILYDDGGIPTYVSPPATNDMVQNRKNIRPGGVNLGVILVVIVSALILTLIACIMLYRGNKYEIRHHDHQENAEPQEDHQQQQSSQGLISQKIQTPECVSPTIIIKSHEVSDTCGSETSTNATSSESNQSSEQTSTSESVSDETSESSQ